MQNKFLITLLKLHNQLKYLFFVLQANMYRDFCYEIYIISVIFLFSLNNGKKMIIHFWKFI